MYIYKFLESFTSRTIFQTISKISHLTILEKFMTYCYVWAPMISNTHVLLKSLKKVIGFLFRPPLNKIMFSICKFHFYDELMVFFPTSFLATITHHNLPSSWLYIVFCCFQKKFISYHYKNMNGPYGFSVTYDG